LFTPQVGLRFLDPRGSVLQEIQPRPRRKLDISAQTRSTIMGGLRAAANDPGGTSAPVFEGFPITVAGKTGTAERGPQGDQSWYVAVAPYNDPRVAVAVTIERGGFGAEAAAPAARRILAAYFGVKGKKALGKAGSSPD
jgi:penicillin-binding protein 2